MTYTFQIQGEAADDQALYDLAIRFTRKAREVGRNVSVSGSFKSGPVDENLGVDPPDNPFVGCQNCETDGWPTPMDRNEPCPSCGASWDPELGTPQTGESQDATVQVPVAQAGAEAGTPS